MCHNITSFHNNVRAITSTIQYNSIRYGKKTGVNASSKIYTLYKMPLS